MFIKFSKINVRTLSCLAVLLTLPASQAQNTVSPCPGVFLYNTELSKPGRQYGTVYLTSDTTVQLQSLNIILDKKVDVLGNWMADVTTTDNMNFVMKNTQITIYPGKTTKISFYFNYNVMKPPAPKVKRILFNGEDICNADNPAVVITRRTKPAQSNPSDSSGESEDVGQCGRVVKENIIELIVSGTTTSEGEWPWHVALFKTTTWNSGVVGNTYICGGSLVSHYHVITAGHCVTEPEGRTGEVQHPRPVNNVTSLTVYLGKHNLRYSVEGVQIRLVSNIIRHPEYNTTLRRDVAIIRLKERVNYTPWVQPVCLWPADQISLSSVIGKTGSVVGWGQNENNKLQDELALAKMQVVSSDTCRESRPSFYGIVTSDYTYCAGKNGPSVCRGDSGGGMVFRMNGVWYLRGLVSLARRLDGGCDPDQYVVFTDLAKFLPWIRQNIT